MMKICFVWPFKFNIRGEGLEIYNSLKERNDIILTDSFDEADYIFYMMDFRNCFHMPWYNKNDFDMKVLQKIYSQYDFSKDVIIDYNDWVDTRNVQEHLLHTVHTYFKRSIVDKKTMTLIPYTREIIPISYAIRSDYLNYDKLQSDIPHVYDVCCLFNRSEYSTTANRHIANSIVDLYDGPKYVGLSDTYQQQTRYDNVNEEYYKILKTSKIIVTANPPDWEGDFRLWEALLVGNLVLCDRMVIPHIMKYPLINEQHLIFYDNVYDILNIINYYIENEPLRAKIGASGREYVLKYHKFSNRLDDIIEHLQN
jgi:spore maturation protein CgeB